MMRKSKKAMDDREAEAVMILLRTARAGGIVAGLEMAQKFMSMTKKRSDVEAMIKAAIATAALDKRTPPRG